MKKENSHTLNPKRSSKQIWVFSLVGILLVFVGGFLALSLWFNSYLQSDNFRKLLNQKTSILMKAEGEYMPFHWNGSSVYSDGFSASGQRGALLFELRADQIRAEFNLRGLFKHAWQVDEIHIQRFQATFDQNTALSNTLETSTVTALSNPTTPQKQSSWLPDKVDLHKVEIQETDLIWKQQNRLLSTIQKTHLLILPEDQAFSLTGTGGQLHFMDWPVLKTDHFKLRYQKPQLFITDGQFRLNETGILNVSGEVDLEKGPLFDLLVKFDGVAMNPLLPEDWRAKLKGNLRGNIQTSGRLNHAEPAKTTGTLSLSAGQLEALPILNQIAIFTHTQQFRQLVLQKASADFSWEDPKLVVTHLILESEGLLRVEGNFIVEHGEIEGQFQVGVTPASLQWLPGAQVKVFTNKRDGYLWAPMKLTGPAAHPNEDLSQRLISAAGSEVIEEVGKTIEKKSKEVLDLVIPLLP